MNPPKSLLPGLLTALSTNATCRNRNQLRMAGASAICNADGWPAKLQRSQRFNFALNGSRFSATHQAQVVVGLQARPHFRAGAKVARHP